jgi:hypothetical protein
VRKAFEVPLGENPRRTIHRTVVAANLLILLVVAATIDFPTW